MCDLKGHSPLALALLSLPACWLLAVLDIPCLGHELKWPRLWVSHVACLLGIQMVATACFLFCFLISSPLLLSLCLHLLLPHGDLFFNSQMCRQDLEWKERPSSFWHLRKGRNQQFGQLLPTRHWAELWAWVILGNPRSSPMRCILHLYSTDGDTGAQRM